MLQISADRASQGLVQQDLTQAEALRGRGSPYRELTNWYLAHWRESGVEDDISHWGVDYATYASEYVKEFAKLIPLDDLRGGSRVWESAVGAGWLIRGLIDHAPGSTEEVQW